MFCVLPFPPKTGTHMFSLSLNCSPLLSLQKLCIGERIRAHHPTVWVGASLVCSPMRSVHEIGRDIIM